MSHRPLLAAAASFHARGALLGLLGLASLASLVSLGSLSSATHAAEAGFAFQKGDRIALVGNALAERMQHDGWLETFLQARRPALELSCRNLGFSGDTPGERLRSQGFGSVDENLQSVGADVILAFFGFNESFAGNEGLASFEESLSKYVDERLAHEYGGAKPRIVLVSPAAHEDLGNPSLPDGRESNARLELYTNAIRKVAAARELTFVDIFRPTLKAFADADTSFTINGVHLTSEGNRLVGQLIAEALAPGEVALDEARLERIRAGVRDRNFYWFQRHRTTDGFNVHGGRSSLKYTDGISNWDVLQREMHVLDAMCDLRDARIHALARGEDLEVDDSKTPEFIAVKTNIPGKLPDGSHEFLSGEQAIAKMTAHDGMRVELFADEGSFPEIANPVQMAFDRKDRLWIAAWPTYPHWKPKDPMNDKLVILEDDDQDGRADRAKVFAGDLHNPTGFEFWGKGVLVAQVPDLLYLEDTDGDDRADKRVRVLHGLGSADTHHSASSFVIDPGGALYFSEGTFHRSSIESPWGLTRNRDGCIWRFEPRTFKVSRYIPYNFANPHGDVVDAWGQQFVHDGTGAVPFHATLFSGHIDYPAKHPGPPPLYNRRTRPCSGTEILSSTHFPDELQGNLLVNNVIGFLGILQYEFEDDGSSFQAKEVQPIVQSSDPFFRPADLEIGPDGALWFTDWQNPIIGHMQHHLRDPNRDKVHGRVYRVVHTKRPLTRSPRIADAPIESLLHTLKFRDDRIRYRARLELAGRDTGAVIASARKWIAALDPKDPDLEHHVLEGLWLHQSHDVVDAELLGRVLGSPDFRARAAATRVFCYWHDRLESPLDTLKKLVSDEHPRVRLEAVRAASFFSSAKAMEIALEALEKPDDRYLKFTLDRTLKQLEKY